MEGVMSKGIGLRALLGFCFLSFAVFSTGGAAMLPADFFDGFEPQSVHHVQMLVLSEHFDASAKELQAAAQKLDTVDEMTAAFFLWRESGRRLGRVLKQRASGATWWEMAQELKVHPGWLYRDNLLQVRSLGKAGLGNLQARKARPMTDARFVELVCAQVTGEFFDTAPSLVLQAHQQGRSFRDIQYTFYHSGRGHDVSPAAADDLAPAKLSARPRAAAPAPEAQKPVRRSPGQRPAFE